MSVVFVGGAIVAALLILQGVLWRIAAPGVADDPDEYGRTIDGKRAVLTFFEHAGATHLRAQIDLAHEAPRLELARRGAPPVLAKWVGALSEHALGDAALAARFVCRAPESPRAFEALGRLKARLLDACEPAARVREVKLDRTSLTLVLRDVGRGDLDATSELLGDLAAAVDGPGGVLVRGEDALHARCGFCHADLAAEALAAVTCDGCGAVVHELCWAEHGRCPVLGCKGIAPARVSSGLVRG